MEEITPHKSRKARYGGAYSLIHHAKTRQTENQEKQPADQTGQALRLVFRMCAKVCIFAKKRTFSDAKQHKARRGAG
ncbi:TPA: hypothetical protein H2X16_004265 [Salmonella enterica]|nr:hypothetical protein [Salmonella enterica]